MGLYFTISAVLHTFVIQQSHWCLSWFTAFNILKRVKIARAFFAFFKFLFSPLNFMFTFDIIGFVSFPYLDKISLPQRGEWRNIAVASVFFFCSIIRLFCGFLMQGFGGFFHSL